MAKQDKLNRVPPFLPLLWQDWLRSGDVRSMTMAQRGIYLEILVKQWVLGSVPRDAWKLAKGIQADYRATVRLLTTYSHLLACCQCGASWTPVTCQCGASNLTATCHSPKLRNLRNDVDSDLALGTTEPNLTQPKLTEPHPAASPLEPPSPTGGGGVSSPVVEGYFGQGNKRNGAAAVVEQPTPDPTPNPLVDEFIGLLGMVKPPSPQTYNYWSEVFGRLVDAHGRPRFRTIMAYCFEHERYCRGIRTVKKQDKADWLSEHFAELAERMVADEEFESKRGQKAAKYKVGENKPDYIANPSGTVGFGKSVV
jgi:hypothetical protein